VHARGARIPPRADLYFEHDASPRLCKKPPSDRPDINARKPWSEMDLADLEEMLGSGDSIEGVARRDVDEVEIETKVRRLNPKVDAMPCAIE
jgi:hypothetical protein